MKLLKNIFLILVTVSGTQTLHAQTWVQKGTDIDGEAAGDYFGGSVSMPDANTIAIGASGNDETGSIAGHVRIFRWNGITWSQKGSDINGEAAEDWSGGSVSMPDSNTVAIGAAYNDGKWNDAGHVRIFSWDGGAWVQKGSDIDGESEGEWSGMSVCMPDNNTLAVGAPRYHGNGAKSGQVRIFKWNGNAWVLKGSGLNGEFAGDFSGGSVSMPDSNTVAIGAPYNDRNGDEAGHVRIYKWTGEWWTPKGLDIDGEAPGDQSGRSVSMPDSNTVAIGAPNNDGTGIEAGHVRIYYWNGSAWVQKGSDIDGKKFNDGFGSSVSMPDANTVAIGASDPFNFGHIRIYKWNGNGWIQMGKDVNGENYGDGSTFVSMPDDSTLAVGVPNNDGNGSDAGHVRVYQFKPLGFIENGFNEKPAVYPNPTEGDFTIDLGASYESADISVRDICGQLISSKTIFHSQRIVHSFKASPGVYLIYIQAGNKKAVVRLFKE